MAEVETYRRTVTPQDCDMLGHMNVARYFEAASEGGFAHQAAFGLTREDMLTGRRLSFVVVRAESAFHTELRAGEEIYVRSGLVEARAKTALFRHRLYRAADDVLSFETRFQTVLMNLETRRAVRVPAELQAAMAPYGADD